MSCSSSTTIKPKFLKGRNREDLAPIINFESPVNISCQISFILPLDKWTNIIGQNSNIFHTTTSFHNNIVSFFGWEDLINYSENLIKDLVQP